MVLYGQTGCGSYAAKDSIDHTPEAVRSAGFRGAIIRKI